MLDFRIHTFLAVCKYKNYTQAAKHLHITQPAVSQQIKYLETLYNTKLFHYQGKTLTLTPNGEKLFHKATALVTDEIQFQKELTRPQTTNKTYNLGVTYTVGEYLLPKPLATYLNNHNDIQINLTMKNTAALQQDLLDGKIQFAIIEGTINNDLFTSLTLTKENFIPIASIHHTFQTPLHLANLTNEHLILREQGSGTRDILEKALALNNLTPNHFHKTSYIGSMPTIVELIKQDYGITFLYESAVKHELHKTIQTIPLNDFNIKHDISFIYIKDSSNKDLYNSIFNDLKEALKTTN